MNLLSASGPLDPSRGAKSADGAAQGAEPLLSASSALRAAAVHSAA